MDINLLVTLGIIVLLLVIAAAALTRRRHTGHVARRFGPEYDRPGARMPGRGDKRAP